MWRPLQKRARSFSIPDDLCDPCEAHHEEELNHFQYLTISAIHSRPITKKSLTFSTTWRSLLSMRGPSRRTFSTTGTWRSLLFMWDPSRRRVWPFPLPDDLCDPCEAHHEEELNDNKEPLFGLSLNPKIYRNCRKIIENTFPLQKENRHLRLSI